MILRDTQTGYYYICAHVNDFKVVTKSSSYWIDHISSAFIVKQHGPHNYYLRNDYTCHDCQDMWTYDCQTYAKAAISKVEPIYGCPSKESTPLPVTNCHPELDISPSTIP